MSKLKSYIDNIYQLVSAGGYKNIMLAYELVKSQKLQDQFYYLVRFGDMLDYLQKFEHIDIIRLAFNLPDLGALAKIEQEINASLDAGVRQFYEQCGGMELYWLDKRNSNYQSLKHETYPNYGVDGYIEIKGIYEIYHENALEAYGHGQEFQNVELSADEVEATFHSFDYFSMYYDMMAYTGTGFEANPVLVMGDDHQACYTDARLVDIPSYLELVFHSCGVVRARPHSLKKYQGHKLDIFKWDKAHFDQFQRPDFSDYPCKLYIPQSNY